MKFCDVIRNLQITALDGVNASYEIENITYDSRKAYQGSLFVCLRGVFSDGHNYAERAYSQGCRAFLCDHKLTLPDDAMQVITYNTRRDLSVVSADFYEHPADSLNIIAITGTKGKTTTALLIYSIMSKCGKKCAYIGSNGVICDDFKAETENTTPESLDLQKYFRKFADRGVEYVILEVSSQALMTYRVNGITFRTCIYTNLSPDHIGNNEHPDLEAYIAAKALLFSDHGCETMIYNADDGCSSRMLENASATKFISYAVDAPADFGGRNFSAFKTTFSLGISFDCVTDGETVHINLPIPGEFNIHNALAAIAACTSAGLTLADCAASLPSANVHGRFEIVETLPGRTFVIDYAHNGISLTSALTTLRAYNPKRLICVFGSVGGRTKSRRADLAHAASNGADYCIITSDNPNYELPSDIIADIVAHYDGKAPYTVIEDRETAVREVVHISRPGDIILFAGKGHESYQLVLGQKMPFSEREILLDECAHLVAPAT